MLQQRTSAPAVGPSYDVVGCYHQDQVNGFTDEFLDGFLDLAELAGATSVLDAMGGDGNLTARLLAYCKQRGLPPPRCVVLEYSQVQCEFARLKLEGTGAEVVCGDVLGMTDRATGSALAGESFDRVLIKSGSHEIPLGDQAKLCAAAARVLEPGGLFLNLGFLFDEPRERDEFREIARVKDTLAGMTSAAEHRHFLTREELYGRLRGAGFVEPRCAQHFDYVIHSDVVEKQYFGTADRDRVRVELQVPQVRAVTLRARGRVRFEGERCIMSLPGEMTVARKPSLAEVRSRGPRPEALALLRGVAPHAALLRAVAARIPAGSAVLELGCADGALYGLLQAKDVRYRGVDPCPALVEHARLRWGGRRGAEFAAADLAGIELPPAKYDTVVLLNSYDLPGLDAPELLRRAFSALRPEGRLIVFGPTATTALGAAQAGVLAGAGDPESLREAAARYLSAPRGWSVEGMSELLASLAPCELLEADTGAWDGLGWMVVARKRGLPAAAPTTEEIFQRSLCAHLPPDRFRKLRDASVLVAGLGGGSNIAELLARKGVGRLLIADLDRYEAHNVRQRGSAVSTLGREKTEVMRERLLDVDPHIEVVAVPEGVTLANVAMLVRQSDVVVDMIDFHGMYEKLALYREARAQGKVVVTTPSVIDGGVLYVFAPDGPTWERFFDYRDDAPVADNGRRMLRRLIPRYPEEAPEAMYLAAARGERSIPLDAVGVEQASVLAVAAVANLVLGRTARVVFVPRGIQVDVSDPSFLARIVDWSSEFEGRTC